MHESVLLQEVLELLKPLKGESALDVTVGLGGHASMILEAVGRSGGVTGLDADLQNLSEAKKKIPEAELIHSNFRELPNLGLERVDLILADLGLSSPQIDEADRGFTFRENGPLDLRFDQSQGVSASEYLAKAKDEALIDDFQKYGELRGAHRLVREIKKKLPQTTSDLVACTEAVYGWQGKKLLPQVFQALRIAVNDELRALEVLLKEGPVLLRPGGRMAVISFHSLEDRMVKQVFRTLTTPDKDPITGQDLPGVEFELLTKKPITPSEEEIEQNPRARSAKLRGIRRL